MKHKTTVGAKIYSLRKELGLTQGDLASKVGVSRAAISQFELGDTLPSFETQKKLSDALSFDLLSDWSASPKPDSVDDDYLRLDFWPIAAYPFIAALANGKLTPDIDLASNTVPVLRLSGIDYDGAYVFEIKGNSMMPRYPHGSRYLIKQIEFRENELRHAIGVHLFVMKDRAPILRRVVSTKGGILTLRADANGEEMDFPMEEMSHMIARIECFVFKLGQAVHMPPEE
jgi:transcriptional regulator with XRE-family HTH domain